MAPAERDVADGRGGLERDAVAGGLEREDGVHRVQHGGGGAEGDFQVDLVPAAFRQLDSGLEMAAHAGELGGVGPLEAVDRLLLVADREQRADSVGAGGVGEELLGECRDHLPLLRVGVLRLVDQDMVEAAVQLEQHPGGDAVLGQQVLCGQDQVVIVQPGAVGLELGVGLDQRFGQDEQGGGGVGDSRRLDPVEDLAQALGLGHQGLEGGREGCGGLLRQQGLAGDALGGEEVFDEFVEALDPGFGGVQPRLDADAAFLIGVAAGRQGAAGVAEGGHVEHVVVAGLFEDRGFVGAGRHFQEVEDGGDGGVAGRRDGR